MNYYTSTISVSLAEKLKEKGMPMKECLNIISSNSFSDDGGIHFYYLPIFASCFDWLMEQGVDMELSTRAFFLVWDKDGPSAIKGKTWHEAAEKAIEKALTLI